MTWLFVVIGIAVLAFVFMTVLGPLGELPPVEPDVTPDTIDGQPQFDVVVRGYRMDEVDEQLAAMQAEIDRLRGVHAPSAADSAPVAAVEPVNQPHEDAHTDANA
jgi:hypothetical protein